jgi:hypothetical protein
LRRSFPNKWQSVAEVTCMRRGWFAPNQHTVCRTKRKA